MRRAIPPLLLLAAAAVTGACTGQEIDPNDYFELIPPGRIEAEVATSTTSPATVRNIHAEHELIIAGIAFDPADETHLNWFGEGPWELPAGQEKRFDVWFRASEEGPFQATLTVETDAGELTVPLDLVGLPPVDNDQDGYSVALGDCDDDNPDVNPDAVEICDGIDNDCDEDVDGPFDKDKDGFVDDELCPEDLAPLDCNDNDGTTYPGREEECDGSDSDCNGVVDDIDIPADLQDGVCEGALKRCTSGGPVEPNYAAIEGYEQLEFSCDAIDNDCDGVVDAFDRLGDGTDDCVDDDGDGEREVDGDCDDLDKEKTSSDCGPATLLVTRNDDGFAKIDLNSGKVELVDIGVRSYHGVAVSPTVAWFAARDDGYLYRYDFDAEETLFTTRFDVAPVSVEYDPPSGDLLVLLADGNMQRRNESDGNYRSEIALTGSPTAWTRAPDGTLWICTSGDGNLVHASLGGVLDVVEITTACYGPPALKDTRLVVPGLDDRVLIEIDTTTLEETIARGTDKRPVRAAWVSSDLWVTTSVNATVDVYDGSNLLRDESIPLDGQTQGIWYDPSREVVWVAVFGADEVVAFDRRSRKMLSRLPVPDPIYLFPLPPE